MANTLDIYESFASCESFEQLWNTFHQIMENYGVVSISYGHSVIANKKLGVNHFIDSLHYKTSHSDMFHKHYGLEHSLKHDLLTLHCLHNVTPFIWHDREQWKGGTPEQITFMEETYAYGLGPGITIPLRFGDFGIGGVGLSGGYSTEQEFGKVLKSYQETMIAGGYMFDEFTRKEHIECLYDLSSREKEILKYMADGLLYDGIAHQMSNTAKSLENPSQRIRKKLKARNNIQAVVKALHLKLI